MPVHFYIKLGNSTYCVRWVSDLHKIIDFGSLLKENVLSLWTEKVT